eukprot:gene9122-13439_t
MAKCNKQKMKKQKQTGAQLLQRIVRSLQAAAEAY